MTDRLRASELLEQLHSGTDGTESELLTILYDQLRSVAARMLATERPDHTLQPTALVHEAWVRLIDQSVISTDTLGAQRQFVGLAARAMRQVLIDHARRHKAEKRGGDFERVALPEGLPVAAIEPSRLLDLESALLSLEKKAPRKARIAELRIFGGLSVIEAAEALEISPTAAKTDWQLAQALLTQHLRDAQ